LYLCSTINWGIIYWRSAPRKDLPAHPLDILTYDPKLSTFPQPFNHFQLTGYVDAAQANDLQKRRSTTSYAFMLSGGAIAWRSKTQSITGTSSTEAKFVAVVSAAKVAKYLQAILRQLGFPQKDPPNLFEDNEPTIKMV
jgi:hypothetical protein